MDMVQSAWDCVAPARQAVCFSKFHRVAKAHTETGATPPMPRRSGSFAIQWLCIETIRVWSPETTKRKFGQGLQPEPLSPNVRNLHLFFWGLSFGVKGYFPGLALLSWDEKCVNVSPQVCVLAIFFVVCRLHCFSFYMSISSQMRWALACPTVWCSELFLLLQRADPRHGWTTCFKTTDLTWKV